MFFCLSGFLIIRQLYTEKLETNTISLKNFFLRRILRIFPLYYLILTVGLIHYHYLLPSLGYEFQNNYCLSDGILLSVFFMPNIFASLYSPGGIIEILWSIGIEEQFYLFIAPLMFLIPTNKIEVFLILFTTFYFILFFSNLLPFLQQFEMYFFYFSMCGLFSILEKNSKKIPQKKYVNYFIFILTLLYFFTNVFKSELNETMYHLFSMILFSVLIHVLATKPYWLLNQKIFNHFGKISYGIYMYHAIAIQIVGFVYLKWIIKLQLQHTTIIFFYYLLSICLTLLISHLSFLYFESFFLKLKKRYK